MKLYNDAVKKNNYQAHIICLSCKSTDTQTLFTSLDSKNKKYFQIIKCQSCLLVFTYPKLLTKKLYPLYYSSYRSNTTGQRFPFIIDFIMKIWRYLRAYRMAKLAKKHPILDVGCGQSIELQILRDFGFKVYGLEYSKKYAKSIQKAIHIRIFFGSIVKLSKLKQKFGLISYLHSLEHIKDFKKYIKVSYQLLNKHGYLLISVPNYTSLEAKIFKQHWFHLDVPRHIYHFSENFLVSYLSKTSFVKISTKHVAPEYDFFSLLQSCLNYIFPKYPNLLYRILLHEEKKSSQDYILLIIQIPYIIFLSLMIFLIMPCLWITKSTGTVEIVFKKI